MGAKRKAKERRKNATEPRRTEPQNQDVREHRGRLGRFLDRMNRDFDLTNI